MAVNLFCTGSMAEGNEKMTKAIILNFTKNYKFTTRLSINNKEVEITDGTHLLRTIIQNDLK